MNNNVNNAWLILEKFFDRQTINDARDYFNNENVIKCSRSLYDFLKDSQNIKNDKERVAVLLTTIALLNSEKES